LRGVSTSWLDVDMVYPFFQTVPPRPEGTDPMTGGWDDEPWAATRPVTLEQVMGDPPEHVPVARARLLYDSAYLYVAFSVADRYVLAACATPATVCQDSCVELFFTPCPTTDAGYFNIECNCGGTVLFRYQRSRGVGQVGVDPATIGAMDVRATMPPRVSPEIVEPVTWSVRYRVPLSVLGRYARVEPPSPGVRWRANLYKCADASSHPHWLTWSPVDPPRPDFHRPEYFGYLVFA
jgi:hypothetical protein